jgi:DNA-binding ferritin-like protein (Dps family)
MYTKVRIIAKVRPLVAGSTVVRFLWYSVRMLDAQDIQKLTEVLATKEDFRRLDSRADSLDKKFDEKFDALGGRMTALEGRSHVFEEKLVTLEERLSNIEESQQSILTILDKISNRLDVMYQEYLVMKERDTRYERWFKQIADKVGITLVP